MKPKEDLHNAEWIDMPPRFYLERAMKTTDLDPSNRPPFASRFSPDTVIVRSKALPLITPRRFTFQCLYVRPAGDRFELIAQWIAVINDDFTFDEQVLATADTPNDLPLDRIGRDFVMPSPPH
jgi:hypothetical protein